MTRTPLTRLPCILLCLLALVQAGCSRGSGQRSTPDRDASQGAVPMHFLAVEDMRILDEQGREVILRGINHIALRSDRNHPPYRGDDGRLTADSELFELQDLEEADFDFIASMGLNALRLVVTWEFAQPDPPPAPYNEAYFRRIDDFIASAKARGLYVIFDFGQFGWGRSLGGNAGAPDWTVSDTCRQLPGPAPNAPPQASGSVGCAYYNFWINSDTAGMPLQDAYIDLWRFVAQRYRDEPAVAMYDLYNEPFGGPLPPGIFEFQYLFPFYQRLAAAIREVDPRHAVAFQPQLFHSIGVPTPFAVPLNIPNAIYIPHEYTAAYFAQRVNPAYTPLQDAITALYLNVAQAEAGIFGTPWMIGETGWTRSTSADGVGGPLPATDEEAPRRFAREFTARADALRLGWMWFAYSSIDEAYGINYEDMPDLPLVAALSRPFPRAVAGRVQSFGFDPDDAAYRQETRAIFGRPSEIALPLHWHYPRGACVYGAGRLMASLDADGSVAVQGVRFDARRQVLVLDRLPEQLQILRREADCAAAVD